MRYHYIVKVLTLVFILTFISSFIPGNPQAQQNQKSANAGKQSGTTGEELLTVTLKAPEDKLHQTYLGIGDKNFNIADIAARVVLVEIFSMYCPHCQKDAPNMNAFFSLVKKSNSYRDRIKLIGIGVGNSAFEVDFFRKNYSIEFPLLPDQDFKIHKLLGGVRTPYFIGFKLLKDGSASVFLSEAGGDREPESFLQQIIQQAELK